MTKEEAIKRFETLLLHIDTDCVMGTETTEAINMAIKALEQPERKTGKWIDEGFYADGHGAHAFRCSECGGHIIEYDTDPFCKWCGADMRIRETDCDYERAVESLEHDILYEPTFNQDDGSMCEVNRMDNRKIIYLDDAIDALDCINGVEEVLRSLPSAQPERTCVNCGRTANNGGWYADGRTRCPIEEHYALPKDGYCHLWEKRNVTDDDYPERREE